MTFPTFSSQTRLSTSRVKPSLTDSLVSRELLKGGTTSMPIDLEGKDPTRQGQPPSGFQDPVSGIPTGTLPHSPTADDLAPGSSQEQNDELQNRLDIVDRAAVIDAMLGMDSTTATAPQTDLTDSAEDSQPGIDQGFTGKPVNLASDPLTLLNPMDPFRGGSVGGPLGTAAADDPNHNGNGIASQGIGAVSDGGVTTATGTSTDSNNEVKGSAEQAEKAKDTLTKLGLAKNGDHANEIAKTATGIGDNRNGSEYLKGEFTDKMSSDKINWTRIWEETGEKHTFVKSADGSYYLIGKYTPKDGWTAVTPRKASSPGRPDPENTGREVNIISQAILDQLLAARAGKPASQGGGGDVMPVSEEGVNPVVRNGTIAVNESSVRGQNLFGQPVNPAFDNISGGNKGLNGFDDSNGAGVINPGNEAGSPAGDSRFQQDPGQALGNGQPQLPLRGSSTTSSPATTLIGDDGANTLTGSGAAEQLRGLGGNDRLFGLAGDDRLDGGRGKDRLNGGLGDDRLDGGLGRDLLTGGGGADRFCFAVGRSFGNNLADRITDFRASEGDRIEISRQAFGLAPNTTATVVTARNDAELNQMLASGNTFVLDQRDGSLQFNQNGSAAGAGSGGVFAVLSGTTDLQASSLALIA